MRVKELLSDNYKVGMILLELLLLISMKFNPSITFNHFTYFAIISRILFPLVVLLFGNRGIWCFFFITASVNSLDITFDDFTALSVFCILYLFLPKGCKKLKLFTIIIYIVNIFIVATLHGKQPYHLFSHFIGCGMLILSVQKLKYGKIAILNNKLDLTNDEVLILDELSKGKQQKEIEQFSQNTVGNKLKQARTRNNITTTDELIRLYKETK